MSSYNKNKKLIKDYINGNDIDIDIELLENDLDFMIAVIDYSNDQNIYKLCGDDIKYDFEMIKFLIEKFHNDSEFIIETVMDFLDNYDHANWYQKYNEEFFDESNNFEELEVLIAIDKYLEEKMDDRIIEIKIRLKNEFLKFRIVIEAIIQSKSKELSKLELGKGFTVIEMLFPTSYLIKDYYAKSIIDEIIREADGNTYEERIHTLIGSPEKPENALLALINFVKKYDIELSNYIVARQEVFVKYINEINIIITNWDNYNSRKLDEKIQDILDVINDYYYKYGYLLSMEEFEAIKYFASLLNLEEQFKKVDPYIYDCESVEDERKGKTYHDQKMKKDLTKLIKNIIQGKNEYVSDEEVETNGSNKRNITEFRPKK